MRAAREVLSEQQVWSSSYTLSYSDLILARYLKLLLKVLYKLVQYWPENFKTDGSCLSFKIFTVSRHQYTGCFGRILPYFSVRLATTLRNKKIGITICLSIRRSAFVFFCIFRTCFYSKTTYYRTLKIYTHINFK